MHKTSKSASQTAIVTYQKFNAPYDFLDDFAIMYDYTILDDFVQFLHRHNTFEIGYCIKGAGTIIIENKIFPFHAGQICVINNSESHVATNEETPRSRIASRLQQTTGYP